MVDRIAGRLTIITGDCYMHLGSVLTVALHEASHGHIHHLLGIVFIVVVSKLWPSRSGGTR